jgi:D-alanyl-D-alanine carboxypeptidase
MFSFNSLQPAAPYWLLWILLGLTTTAGAAEPQRLVSRARERAQSPALAAAVVTSRSIDVYVSGVARLGWPGRVDEDDAFHVGSDAKAMLATLIAEEVEAGRLRWDSTIGEVLPDAAVTGRPEYRHLTITDLLLHRSGLPQLLTLEDLAVVPPLSGTAIEQRSQFATWALQQPPTAQPGTATMYSNAGYIVAAAMLERTTGQRYESLMQQRLFAPLEIRARFAWPAAQDVRQPWGHASVDGQLVPIDPRDPATQVPVWAVPAGHLSLSTGDFAKFVQLHLRGLRGIPTLLQPATVTELHTPTDNYAYGWAVVGLGDRQISFHEGATGLFYALMIIDAAHDVAAVVVANSDGESLPATAMQLALDLMARRTLP